MIRFFVSFFCAFMLWYMQIIDPKIILPAEPAKQVSVLDNLVTSIQIVLYTYRSWIGFVLSAIIASVSFVDSSWRPRHYIQTVIYNELKETLENCFKNQQAQIRLTVFKCVDFWEAFTHYSFHQFIKNFPKGLPFFGFIQAIQGMPRPFAGKFLIIYSRLGNPASSVHTTYFPIPDNDAERVPGIVGLAWRSREAVKIDLPDISSFSEKLRVKGENSLTNSEKTALESFMKKGNMNDVEMIRGLHRYSLSLWAKVIDNSAGDPWGVFIIDSSNKNILNKTIEGKLQEHSEQIQKIVFREQKERK